MADLNNYNDLFLQYQKASAILDGLEFRLKQLNAKRDSTDRESELYAEYLRVSAAYNTFSRTVGDLAIRCAMEMNYDTRQAVDAAENEYFRRVNPEGAERFEQHFK